MILGKIIQPTVIAIVTETNSMNRSTFKIYYTANSKGIHFSKVFNLKDANKNPTPQKIYTPAYR